MQDSVRVYQVTSRQLLVVAAVGVLALALFPRGVKAATGSAVNITDPANASRVAKVDGFGDLRTLTCDPGVNVCARVDAGSLRVNARSLAPSTPVRFNTRFDANSEFTLGTVLSAGRGLAISSLTMSNETANQVLVFWRLRFNGAGDCGNITSEITQFALMPNDTVHAMYPEPIVLTPAGTFCIRVLFSPADPGGVIGLTLVGYRT